MVPASKVAPGSVRTCSTRSRMRWEMSVQPSCTRSSSAKPPVWRVAKLISHSLLPARLERGEPLGVDRAGCPARRSTTACAGTRTARPRRAPGGGMHCTAVAPVPMMPTRLSASRSMGRARRVAAGVVVVPPAGVERVPAERLDAGDAGQLGAVQRAGAHGHEPGPELVAAVGGHDPAGGRLVPRAARSRSWRAGRRRRGRSGGRCAGRARRSPAAGTYFWLGTVPGLLEQRQVDHRRGVAHGAGVAVPVPGAADVAAALDDADALDAGLPAGGRRWRARRSRRR